MSWDIFVQDIPSHVTSVTEIPGNFEPRPLGPRSKIVEAIRHVAPFADFSEPAWIRIEGHGCDVEVNLRDEDPVRGFALHVRGGDSSVAMIAALLAELGFRAFDSNSETGLFDASTAGASLEKWMAFRRGARA